MRCTFVAMGSENISLQVLSAVLKESGHETTLAYDQALFDDRNYLHMPWVAKWFNHRESVHDQIVRSKPDLVAISVMTPTYTWALEIARFVKDRLGVPVLFGGIHPSTLPELVIANECVDMIVVGEGDYAILDICNAIERGVEDTTIPNVWFKKDRKVIRNECRPLITDLDDLPMPDKELFAPHVPIKNYYLAVTARGCPFTCTYCECSWQAEEIKRLGGRRLRERSPQVVIDELVTMHKRYGFKWVDFRNNTFTATPSWVKEFLPLYKRNIGLPFRIFGHPLTIDYETAVNLKDAGCFSVQLGIESIDPRVRAEIMHRHETNEQILKAVTAMDRAGLNYSCDYILGVPTQTDQELLDAIDFFAERTALTRVSSFMLAYQPRLSINKIGIDHGCVSQEDIVRMENGEHVHYVAEGSVGQDAERFAHYNAFRLIFRLVPMLPTRVAKQFKRQGVINVVKKLPTDTCLRFLDLCMLITPSSKDARTYFKNYTYWMLSRFKPWHPASIWKRKH